MLKLIESFDHIGTGTGGTPDMTLFHGLGWFFGQPGYWSHPAAVIAGLGRLGSRALQMPPLVYGGERMWALPTIQRKCKKIIMGFSMMGGGYAEVIFKYDLHTNFRIRITIDTDAFGVCSGQISVEMQTGGVDPYIDDTRWAGYPVIATAEKIPAPFPENDYHFIELYLDVTDYHNGVAKVAVDGRTYFNKTGIITAAYNVFGDDPFDDRANLNRVKMKIDGITTGLGRTYPAFDCLYIADDQGGYQDDFLGDIFTKTAYPVSDGTKRNWTPVVNSVIVDPGTGHFTLLNNDPIQPADETEYVEADQDMTEDMLGFAPDPVPAGSELIAVNHRTLFRNVASPGNPLMGSVTPLFQMIGNPIVRTESVSKRLADWSYGFLDVYYAIVPVSAALWEEYILEQAEFGYMLKTAETLFVNQEGIDFAEWLANTFIEEKSLEDEFPLMDDVTENALDIALWDILLEEGLGIDEGADDGIFPVDDELDFADALAGDLWATGVVSTGGTATSNSDYSGEYDAPKTFDGDGGSRWSSEIGPPDPLWLQYELAEGDEAAPTQYSIYPYPSQGPRDWLFQGAEEGGGWVTLDQQTDYVFTSGAEVFVVAGWDRDVQYHKFRLYITDKGGASAISIYEMVITGTRNMAM